MGCSLLSNLLSEVSSGSGSSALGMPLEFHVKCKNTMEQSGGLLKVFTLAVQVQYISIYLYNVLIVFLSCVMKVVLSNILNKHLDYKLLLHSHLKQEVYKIWDIERTVIVCSVYELS